MYVVVYGLVHVNNVSWVKFTIIYIGSLNWGKI